MQDFSTVDRQGDMWFVRGEGIVVSFQELDDSYTPVNPADHPRWLNIPYLNIRQELTENPELPGDYQLVLTPEQLHEVPRIGSVTFSITDEEGEVPIALWAGVIRERNLYL